MTYDLIDEKNGIKYIVPEISEDQSFLITPKIDGKITIEISRKKHNKCLQFIKDLSKENIPGWTETAAEELLKEIEELL